MKNVLKKVAIPVETLYHYKDGVKVEGKHSNLSGDCSKLSGYCSEIRGYCSEISGNLSDIKERPANIADYVD